MSVFKCKMCGGTLEVQNDESVAVCEYCGTKQTLPKLDNDRKANLYDRANHFRRNNEFDKAMGIYEQILNDDNTDAEAYWSIVLCRYGIEYVEDPASHKRVPTVNRAQFTSIFDDDNYKSALQYADGYQREVYEEEAKVINEIQKGILAISQKEEPFDVFICYKETDANGRRTQDSVLANDLYHQLKQEGFKVFFSRITLEDKLGTAYEPYIFAALNSAKVMVVLGTKPEYFNAVWVKNEWSRYLALIKNGAQKVLVPAYKDMDPYDLPEEFSHLQAQDMGKLGFMQDLIRGIKKLAAKEEPKATIKETVVVNNTSGGTNVAPLIKRAFMFLEDGEWESADEYCEKVLDMDPENAEAYLGKLMAELRVNDKDYLSVCDKPFDDRNNYHKVIRFGDDKLRAKLEKDNEIIRERNHQNHLEKTYKSICNAMNYAETEEAYKDVAKRFDEMIDFRDSKEKKEKCLELAETARKQAIYVDACSFKNQKTIKGYEGAILRFEQIFGFKDAEEQVAICRSKVEELKIAEEKARIEAERKAEEKRIAAEIQAKKNKKIAAIVTPIIIIIIAAIIVFVTVIQPQNKYNAAVALMEEGKYEEALMLFGEIHGCKDADDYFAKLVKKGTISVGDMHTVGLKSDGTVVAVGDNDYGQCDVSGWEDIVAVSAGAGHTVGLKSDGTVVVVGQNWHGQCDVSGWEDIVAVSAGAGHTVGLKSDGTVVAVGHNGYNQCDVSDWKNIVAISAGAWHTVGLKSDGTVVAVGNNSSRIFGWEDIVAVSAGNGYTVGLKSDGTVVAVGANYFGQGNVDDWKNIIAISAGEEYAVGLKSDGTVVAVGRTKEGQGDVSDWKNIVAISAGKKHTVGLKSDGTVVAVGHNGYGRCDVSDWKNIKNPYADFIK